MKVLMLSIDKTLLGEQTSSVYGYQGDAIDRHRKYGQLIKQLSIIVTAPAGYKDYRISDQVNAYPTHSHSYPGHLLSTLRLASTIYQRFGFELIVAQDLTCPAAWLISRKYKLPFIVNFHAAGFATPEWHSLKLRLILPLVKLALKKAAGVRVASAAVKQQIIQLGFEKQVAVISTPLNLDQFSHVDSAAVKNLRQQYDKALILLTDGRLEAVKNYPLLFEVVKRLKDSYNIRLLIIGSGTEEKSLKAQVSKLQIETNVIFLGAIPYNKLSSYYQAADVFVLASQSESLGKVLLQAGATAKPVVATKTLGAQSIVVHGQTGYLAGVGSSSQFSDYLKKLLNEEKLRLQFGLAAKEYVRRNFDSQKNIRRMIDFWHKVAAK
jgi:glycosyltransferase involved in cell wall biosynthesis